MTIFVWPFLCPLCAGGLLPLLPAVSAAPHAAREIKPPRWVEHTNGTDTMRFCFAQMSYSGSWEDPAAYRGVENLKKKVFGKTKFMPFAWAGYSGRTNCAEDVIAPVYAAVRDSFVAVSFVSFWSSIQARLDSGGRVVLSLSGERRCKSPERNPDACGGETILLLSGRGISSVSGSTVDGKRPFEMLVKDGRVFPGNKESRWPCR